MTYNDYPQKAVENAKKAIEWKEKYGRDIVTAGTKVGWARAYQLANKENISADTIARMAKFNRHRKNSKISPEFKDEPWKDNGYVSWLLWGGDEGIDWAIKKNKEINESSLYIKCFEEFILEIGDRSAKVYNYKFNDNIEKLNNFNDVLIVTFKTDSKLTYTVTFKNIYKFLEVDFSINNEYFETNRGELYKVMATISDIVLTILSKLDDILGLRYNPKGQGNNKDMGEKRDKLYKAFIDKTVKELNKSVKYIKQGATTIAIFK